MDEQVLLNALASDCINEGQWPFCGQLADVQAD